MFLPERLKIVFGGIVVVLLILGYAARRYPTIAWLQHFDLRRRLTPEQRERARRTSTVAGGLEFILLGLGLPLAYGALTVMLFSERAPLELAIVAGISLGCLILGIVILVRRR